MADPALDAATRSMPDGARHESAGWALASAREALAPVRELHKPVSAIWSRSHFACAACNQVWPCATALTCYTTEELSRDVE